MWVETPEVASKFRRGGGTQGEASVRLRSRMRIPQSSICGRVPPRYRSRVDHPDLPRPQNMLRVASSCRLLPSRATASSRRLLSSVADAYPVRNDWTKEEIHAIYRLPFTRAAAPCLHRPSAAL